MYSQTKPHVEIHSDGSYSRKHNYGGWCVLLKWEHQSMMLYGSEQHSTNNRMELMGPIYGLSQLLIPCDVTIHTDSQYVIGGIGKGWVAGWKRNNWITSTGTPVKNVDLWQLLDELCSRHIVRFVWVKGHNGDIPNEVCDVVSRNYAYRTMR